jgi:hypothetical protein
VGQRSGIMTASMVTRVSAIVLTALIVAVASRAASSVTNKQAAQVIACAARGTLQTEMNALSDSKERIKYYAMEWHSGDHRTETAVMLTGPSKALLLEAITSPTGVAIVNVASFRSKDHEWQLEETQGGPALAKEVRSLVAAITKGEKRMLLSVPVMMPGFICTGLDGR